MHSPAPPVMNLDDAEFDDLEDSGFYTSRRASIGSRIGARQLGYNLTVLPPGKAQCPFHSHHAEEEMFLILSGTGELRFGDQRHPLRPHDVVACPTGGPEVAHQIINTGSEDLRYLSLSTVAPVETCEYPDSGKVGVFAGVPGQRRLRKLFRMETDVDYYDRESLLPEQERPAPSLLIQPDDPARPDVYALLDEHLRNMRALSPPESVHALDVSRLQAPDISFFSVRDAATGQLLGCGALKALGARHGEIKSMRTPEALRRRGAGRAMLAHLITIARQRGYERLSLETGSQPEFHPAQRLYASAGFTVCGPFGDYKEDVYSVFMTLAL